MNLDSDAIGAVGEDELAASQSDFTWLDWSQERGFFVKGSE